MRIIFHCAGCGLVVELEDKDELRPPGWERGERIDGTKIWICSYCAPDSPYIKKKGGK